MKSTSVRLEDDQLNRLDALAKTLGQSRSQLLNEAVGRFIDYNEWFLTSVDEGVRAADRGDFAPAGEVQAAFAKWGVDIG